MPTKTAKKKTASKSKGKHELAKVPNTPAGRCVRWIDEDPGKLLNLLPATMDKERYRRIIVAEILGNKKIQACTDESIWGAISLAAKMMLEPGAPGNGWLIPFKEKQNGQWVSICKFMPGYQGLCSFLVGKGAALSIRGEVVRDNDLKFVASNTGVIHEWSPHMSRSRRGKLIACYTNILYPNGVRETVALMSEEQVLDVRAKSKSYQGKGQSPWRGTETDIEEMWKKTSVIRACKGMDFSSDGNAVIREVVEDDSLIYETEYEVHEVAPEDAAPQGSEAVAEKLEAAQVQQTLASDGEPDRSNEGPVPVEHFRCKQCRGIFPTSGPHATTGRSKICGSCSGMDGV